MHVHTGLLVTGCGCRHQSSLLQIRYTCTNAHTHVPAGSCSAQLTAAVNSPPTKKPECPNQERRKRERQVWSSVLKCDVPSKQDMVARPLTSRWASCEPQKVTTLTSIKSAVSPHDKSQHLATSRQPQKASAPPLQTSHSTAFADLAWQHCHHSQTELLCVVITRWCVGQRASICCFPLGIGQRKITQTWMQATPHHNPLRLVCEFCTHSNREGDNQTHPHAHLRPHTHNNLRPPHV